jgi:HPt (histidine-containing phosphotransfer) domain-containing protein
MGVFIDDTNQRLDRLQALAAVRDCALLAREAHALKGSAASMGAAAVADAAGELEQRAQHGRGDWLESVAALRAVAERSYPSLLGWCERSA